MDFLVHRCISFTISVFFACTLFAVEENRDISSNPGAEEIEIGTGALGRRLGFAEDSGVRIGALLFEKLNYLISGGLKPKRCSGNHVLFLDLTLDTEKLGWWNGGKFCVEYFQFNGRPTNRDAGTVQGYSSLVGPPPLDRFELYTHLSSK